MEKKSSKKPSRDMPKLAIGCCAANQLSLLPGPQDRVKPQSGPVLPLPLKGLADQSCNSSPTFLITWTCSHVAVVAHSPVHSTQLDCHYSHQLKVTVYSYIGGLGGPLINSRSLYFMGGTYLNPIFVFLKFYNNSSI